MNVEDLLNMKIDDNPKLKASIEKYRNTDYGKKLESFDFVEKTEVQKLRSSKERKVWKLKRLNVKLGKQRRHLSNTLYILNNKSELFSGVLMSLTVQIKSISEQIGKNSNKIQRLRTLIQQEKVSGNKSNS